MLQCGVGIISFAGLPIFFDKHKAGDAEPQSRIATT